MDLFKEGLSIYLKFFFCMSNNLFSCSVYVLYDIEYDALDLHIPQVDGENKYVGII